MSLTRRTWVAFTGSLLLALGAVLAAPAATSTPATGPGPEPTTRQLKQYRDLLLDLTDPTMEGRGPGTRGIEKARDYIRDYFHDLGLKPAFGESYLQPFDIATDMAAEKQTLDLLDARKLVWTAKPGDFNALAMGKAAGFTAKAVFVGYGIVDAAHNYDSYGDSNAVAGKVAVVFRYEPQDANGYSRWAGLGQRWSRSASLSAKLSWAVEHKAVALVVVNPPSRESNDLLDSSQGFLPGGKIPVMHIHPDAFRKMLEVAGQKSDADALARGADAGGQAPMPLEVIVRGTISAFKPAIVYPYHYRGADLEKFKQLVGADAGVEVRIRDWYAKR